MGPRRTLARSLLAAIVLAIAASGLSARPPEDGPHGHRGPPPDVVPPSEVPWRVPSFPGTYRPLPRRDMMIRHAVVLDGGGHRIDDGDVLLVDGKVAAIGKALPAHAGASEIDATGRWVTPGIVDPHTHDGTYVLPQTAVDRDASDVSEMSDWNDADVWIEHAINPQDITFSRALAGGVTTLQVLPGSGPLIGGRSVVLHNVPANTVADMKFPGAPGGMKMACGENPKGVGAEMHRAPTSRGGEIALLRKAFADADEYRFQWRRAVAGHGRPPDRDLKKDTLAALLDGDIRLNMHCYRADEMATMIGVAHEFGFHVASFHHAVEAYKIAPMLKAENICAAVWPDWWGFKMEAADAIRENAAFLDHAGACTMMHSDSPFSGQRLNLEAAKAAAAGRRAGLALPPEQVIRWITSNPAAALGLGDRIGTLAPGMDADVVIWSGDPFSVYTHADTVLIDGAVAFDRRNPARRPRSDFELGRPTMERP